MSFNSKWFISDIHWISTGEKPNPKPNPIPNPKTVGEKPSPNPNPQDPKPAGIRPEPDPLPLSMDGQIPSNFAKTKLTLKDKISSCAIFSSLPCHTSLHTLHSYIYNANSNRYTKTVHCASPNETLLVGHDKTIGPIIQHAITEDLLIHAYNHTRCVD
jgi:hypothetical protein